MSTTRSTAGPPPPTRQSTSTPPRRLWRGWPTTGAPSSPGRGRRRAGPPGVRLACGGGSVPAALRRPRRAPAGAGPDHCGAGVATSIPAAGRSVQDFRRAAVFRAGRRHLLRPGRVDADAWPPRVELDELHPGLRGDADEARAVLAYIAERGQCRLADVTALFLPTPTVCAHDDHVAGQVRCAELDCRVAQRSERRRSASSRARRRRSAAWRRGWDSRSAPRRSPRGWCAGMTQPQRCWAATCRAARSRPFRAHPGRQREVHQDVVEPVVAVDERQAEGAPCRARSVSAISERSGSRAKSTDAPAAAITSIAVVSPIPSQSMSW